MSKDKKDNRNKHEKIDEDYERYIDYIKIKNIDEDIAQQNADMDSIYSSN